MKVQMCGGCPDCGATTIALFMRPGSQLEINLDIRDAENWKAVFKGDYAAENDYQFI